MSNDTSDIHAAPIGMGRTTLAFIDELGRMTSQTEVLEGWRKQCSDLGFDYSGMIDITLPPGLADRHIFFAHAPVGFLEAYAAADMDEVDPVLKHLRRNPAPVEWKDVRIDPVNIRRGTEVMRCAADFGLKFGLSMLVQSAEGTTTAIALCGFHRPDLPLLAKPGIQLVSTYALDRIRQLGGLQRVVVNPLTEREREVLLWSAHGKSAADIADILGVAERTATFHIVNATAKMKASNKTQAVARALAAKFIQL